MRRTLKTIPVAALLLASLPAAGFAANDGWAPRDSREPAPRAVTSGNCAGLTEVSYKTNSRFNIVSAFSGFVNIPDSGVRFTQGSAGCVIVTFSAEAWAPSGRLMEVKVRLDGSKNAEPDVIQFSGDDDDWAGARSFTFVFPNVATGSHAVNIQFRNADNDNRVYIGDSTTTVQHR